MKNYSPEQEEKIIQIIPSPTNLFIEYQECADQVFKEPAICLALTDQGEILIMVIDDTGFIDRADSIENFKGIVWENR
jgi:hypothetical protein